MTSLYLTKCPRCGYASFDTIAQSCERRQCGYMPVVGTPADPLRTAGLGEQRCSVTGCVKITMSAISEGRCYKHLPEDCVHCGRERLDWNPRCDDQYDGRPVRHKWVKRVPTLIKLAESA